MRAIKAAHKEGKAEKAEVDAEVNKLLELKAKVAEAEKAAAGAPVAATASAPAKGEQARGGFRRRPNATRVVLRKTCWLQPGDYPLGRDRRRGRQDRLQQTSGPVWLPPHRPGADRPGGEADGGPGPPLPPSGRLLCPQGPQGPAGCLRARREVLPVHRPGPLVRGAALWPPGPFHVHPLAPGGLQGPARDPAHGRREVPVAAAGLRRGGAAGQGERQGHYRLRL